MIVSGVLRDRKYNRQTYFWQVSLSNLSCDWHILTPETAIDVEISLLFFLRIRSILLVGHLFILIGLFFLLTHLLDIEVDQAAAFASSRSTHVLWSYGQAAILDSSEIGISENLEQQSLRHHLHLLADCVTENEILEAAIVHFVLDAVDERLEALRVEDEFVEVC